MRLQYRIAPVLLATATLNGCGLNAIIVESAENVGDLSEEIADSANAILQDAQARRQSALITLVASDPSCSPVFPVQILVPDGTPTARGSVPLCWEDGSKPTPRGYRRQALDLSAIDMESISPTIDLIAAAAGYGEALTKIVDRPKTDVSATLNSALSLAQRAFTTANALGATNLPNLADITDEQKSTATELIQMIADLEREQLQVKDIRVLYDKHAAKLGQFCHKSITLPTGEVCRNSGIYADLGQAMTNWSRFVAKPSSQLERQNLRRAYDRERLSLGYEGRVAFVTLINEADKEPARIEKASDAFGQALAGLSEANRVLGRQLNNPSKEDRQRAAVISRQRIMNALSLLLKAATAWKVI